jgi:hypothetical protein
MSKSLSLSGKTVDQQIKIEQSVGQSVSNSSQNLALVNKSGEEIPNPDNVVDTLR